MDCLRKSNMTRHENMDKSDQKIEFLTHFEKVFNPSHPEESGFDLKIIGFGEISAIFVLDEKDDVVYKRMPLFNEAAEAKRYAELYNLYCKHLSKAGLNIPTSHTSIVYGDRGNISLYISQVRFKSANFAHKLLYSLTEADKMVLLDAVFSEIESVFFFNRKNNNETMLSIDGQLSNWVMENNKLWFIDTSTPLFKINKTEQLDPEPLLKSAPSFLRWILRLFFLDDVMNRYYDQRLVFIDLIANLQKEQLPELIPEAIKIANKHLNDQKEITSKEIDDYYREDKIIWTLFLAFRKFDRWMTTKIFRNRYEFILPGKIKR